MHENVFKKQQLSTATPKHRKQKELKVINLPYKREFKEMIKHSANPIELRTMLNNFFEVQFSNQCSINNEILNWVQYSFKTHAYLFGQLFLTETNWGKRVN